MKIILFNIYSLLFVFLPVPLFLDLASFSIVYIDVNEFNYFLDRPGVPVPIGAFALFLSIVLGYVCSIIVPDRMSATLSYKKFLLFCFFVFVPFFIYVRFVSGLSLARVAQIMLPMLFLSMLSFPRSGYDRRKILRNVLLGGTVFFGMHFLSIISQAGNFLRVNEKLEFSSFFGVLIYQSLVSYPGVLSLYFFLTLGVVYASKLNGRSFGSSVRIIGLILPWILLYLLAASGRRAFLVELTSGALLIFLTALLYTFATGMIAKRGLTYLLLFGLLVGSFFAFYLLTPLSERLISSMETNTLDSGRLDILKKAYDFFTNNIGVLFFGAGGSESPGFHNYFLDQVYRVGLLGFISLYLVNGYLVVKFIRACDTGSPARLPRFIFSIVLLSCLFWQSMINASISQPFYFVNFLIISVLSFFVVFGRDEKRSLASN